VGLKLNCAVPIFGNDIKKSECKSGGNYEDVRFEVFTAVTVKNGVFWDVPPCGSCNNRTFGGT
jgi:hypothetical protein